jgi:hypothetical protein
MTPDDKYQHGAAIAKDAAFDAVYELWNRRRSESNWMQKTAAESIGRDEGWLSKQFNGPRNWTMETFGALVQALNGEITIIVRAMEDVLARQKDNYDAYAEMDDITPPPGALKQLKPEPDNKPQTDGTKKLEFLTSQ